MKKTLKLFREKWPVPEYDITDEPHILFIITPPYSGSTALAKLLNTSNSTMILQKKGEGQWLIPGLCENDKWNPDKKINYESVKAVWLHKYQNGKRQNKSIEVIIEKSPPNMVRIEELSSQFKSYSYIANNRDPYANCASILYRHHDAEHLDSKERIRVLESLADDWLKRSLRIKRLIQKINIPLITYEVFCNDPATVVKVLKTPQGVDESINTDAKVKVKDYKFQKIMNQNERQISNLRKEEIDALSAIFHRHKDLLTFYGYTIL